MSPEQARGEGHLVDGRSDIFGLGVVLYELLTGDKPFSGANWREILEQFTTVEPEPPRQRNETIPEELARICLKTLSKRAADRYRCAADLAKDLRHWSAPPASGLQPAAVARIVPKGLRSFDAADSAFFVKLLPGPRDRDGLPETIRFWKTRIEETGPDKTFRVGLVYGPSGCGKSSLMKAGLLPRLADHVIPVFLEAAPVDMESNQLRALHRISDDLPRNQSLPETISAIRRGRGVPEGRKIVFVLDQFEQWLHKHAATPHTELAVALRQCDGHRVQSVRLVRDDFWVPMTRFCGQLDVKLIQGHNAALVDVFDLPHARKVLAEFGKAYGRLPENLNQLTPPQEAFLDTAVGDLSQEGRVVCVHLALTADMMKDRPWTPVEMKEVGGMAGVGVKFLRETFNNRSAPPQYRRHLEAARAILTLLLPATGTDIKGHQRSVRELQSASGYANRPHDFMELLRILDSEVRLITPVGGNEGSGAVAKSDGQPANSADHAGLITTSSTDGSLALSYQLTHDYLVPSLRDWLSETERATWRGRAFILLDERTADWTRKRRLGALPGPLEYIRIVAAALLPTWKSHQTTRQLKSPARLLLQEATRWYFTGAALLIVLVSILGWWRWNSNGRAAAESLVNRLNETMVTRRS